MPQHKYNTLKIITCLKQGNINLTKKGGTENARIQ